MSKKHLINKLRIKKIKAAVSFWGSFKVRGDSYVEFEAECPKEGFSLSEAKKAHVLLAKELTLQCALDALSRGQISKDHFHTIKERFDNSFDKRYQLLEDKVVADESK